MMVQPEGYVSCTDNAFDTASYVFQYKDHLGNVRLSYNDADKDGSIATAEIIEENAYYPFGMKHSGGVVQPGGNANAQKYKYNGKELQDELGLNLYDYGARNYDAAIGRWMNIDPLAEISRRWSPYNYAMNNPVYFIDPDGMKVTENENGTTYTGEDAKAMFATLQQQASENDDSNDDSGGEDDKKSKSEKAGVVKSADKDRAKKVWAKEKGEQDNNYNFFYKADDMALRRGAEYFDDGGADSNTIVINAHGAAGYIVGPDGSMNAKQLHEFLYANNALYKNSIDNGVKIDIKIVACKTGNSLAASLSKYNKNMTVTAPTTNIVSVSGFYNYPKDGGQYVSYQNGVKK